MSRGEQADGNNGVIVDQRVATLIILDGDLDQIVESGLGIANVLLVATDEAAPGSGAADELQTACILDILAQRLGTTHFHGALLQIDSHHMGGDVCSMQAREEVIGHGQRLAALAFNLADNSVGARVDNPVRAGNVVLEDKQDVAVRQGVQVLGLAGIDLFAGIHRFTRWWFQYLHSRQGCSLERPAHTTCSHPIIRMGTHRLLNILQ